MAKVSITGIPEIERNIRKTFDKVTSSKQMRQEIGEFVVGRIQGEARRGRPLNDDRSLPPLKEITVDIKSGLAEVNPTHPAYKPGKSNLTFSGQLVSAVSFKLTSRAIQIFVEDTKRRLIRDVDDTFDIELQASNKKKAEKTKTNREVDRDLRRRGFFLYTAKGLDSESKVKNRINNIVKKFVRRAIKVNFDT